MSCFLITLACPSASLSHHMRFASYFTMNKAPKWPHDDLAFLRTCCKASTPKPGSSSPFVHPRRTAHSAIVPFRGSTIVKPHLLDSVDSYPKPCCAQAFCSTQKVCKDIVPCWIRDSIPSCPLRLPKQTSTRIAAVPVTWR